MNQSETNNLLLRFSHLALGLLVLCLPLGAYWAARLEFGTTLWRSGCRLTMRHELAMQTFAQVSVKINTYCFSWEGCDLRSPQLAELREQLEQLKDEHPEFGIVQVIDSRSAVDSLASTLAADFRAESDRQLAAERRLQGALVGQGRRALISLSLEPASVDIRGSLIQAVQAEAERVLGPGRLILAGEPFSGACDRSIMSPGDARISSALFRACLSCCTSMFAQAAYRSTGFRLRRYRTAHCMASISYFVGEMAAVLVVIPTLVFMLTLSAVVHLCSYLVDAVGEGATHPSLKSIAMGGRPCMLAALTTAFGFVSLYASKLEPVWLFGSLSASCLLLSTFWTLAAFPSLAQLVIQKRDDTKHAKRPEQAAQSHSLSRFFGSLASATRDWSSSISLFGLVILVLAFVGLGRLRTSTEFEDMFAADSEAVANLHFFQDRFGPLDSLEFLLTDIGAAKIQDAENREEKPVDILQELQLVSSVHQSFVRDERVSSALSAVSLLPRLPSGAGTQQTIRRAVLRKKVGEQLSELESRGLVHVGDQRTWRVSVRIADLRDDNYAATVASMREAVREEIVGYQRRFPKTRVQIELTGLRSIVERAHNVLLRDLIVSFSTAFLLITPIMMVIVRSISGGLLIMVPNLLPVALVFGAMGWLGIPLDVASILTASVALGIAVDDTLHFLSTFVRSLDEGLSRPGAALRAIEVCGRPMLQTTVICTAAMLPFFFSSFLPTSKFALLMILILAGAILGDLILLPALLQTPMGRLVRSRIPNK